MLYLNLIAVIASSFTAGWILSMDNLPAAMLNIFAALINAALVAYHLED